MLVTNFLHSHCVNIHSVFTPSLNVPLEFESVKASSVLFCFKLTLSRESLSVDVTLLREKTRKRENLLAEKKFFFSSSSAVTIPIPTEIFLCME